MNNDPVKTLLNFSENHKRQLLEAIQLDAITGLSDRNNESKESNEYRKLLTKLFLKILHYENKEQQRLFEAARMVRFEQFGNKGILRGVIEVTNACERSCIYCPMRIENKKLEIRYNFLSQQIIETAEEIYNSAIPVVFIQGGEIKATTKTVSEAVPEIRKLFDNKVIILLSLGDKSKEDYALLKTRGANQYIIKFETSNAKLHQQTRGYSLSDRLDRMDDLLNLGYEVGSGVIVGLKALNTNDANSMQQTAQDLANSLLLAMKKKINMCSVSPFIPSQGTPLNHVGPGDANMTLNWMALARILMPEVLIPSVSALNILLGQDGQLQGLNAGAHVITVNFTPHNYRDEYAIYSKQKRHKVKYNYALDLMQKANLEPVLLPNIPSRHFLLSQN